MCLFRFKGSDILTIIMNILLNLYRFLMCPPWNDAPSKFKNHYVYQPLQSLLAYVYIKKIIIYLIAIIIKSYCIIKY